MTSPTLAADYNKFKSETETKVKWNIDGSEFKRLIGNLFGWRITAVFSLHLNGGIFARIEFIRDVQYNREEDWGEYSDEELDEKFSK